MLSYYTSAKEVSAFYETMCGYLENADAELRRGYYEEMAENRSETRSYGEGDFDKIDIGDYVAQTDTEGSEQVLDALEQVVAY